MALLGPHFLIAGITSSIVSAVLTAIAHAISSGITSLAAWAIGGLAHAATATTAVNLDTWFQGPWRAMLTVASLAALPLFFAGILEALAHGEGVGGMFRVVGRLALAGVGSVVALGLVQLLLALVDASCGIVEHTSGISISAALARLGTALGVTGLVGGGALAAVGALLLALLAALAALVLWLELALRSVLILVTTAFLPLGLSGLLWPKTASWLRRLGEVLTAIVISKLVIVVVLVLGAAALTNSSISLSSPGADIDAMVQGVAFLGLATFGLPMALRVVPFAAEAALSPGRGGVLVRSGYAASRFAAGANSTSALIRRAHGPNATGEDGSGPSAPGPSGSGSSGGPARPNPSGPGPTSHGPTGTRPDTSGSGPTTAHAPNRGSTGPGSSGAGVAHPSAAPTAAPNRTPHQTDSPAPRPGVTLPSFVRGPAESPESNATPSLNGSARAPSSSSPLATPHSGDPSARSAGPPKSSPGRSTHSVQRPTPTRRGES